MSPRLRLGVVAGALLWATSGTASAGASRCGGQPYRPCLPIGQYCGTTPATCHLRGAVGVCKTRPQFCIQLYRPVCGCNGKTYGNACEAAAHGQTVASQGECPGKRP